VYITCITSIYSVGKCRVLNAEEGGKDIYHCTIKNQKLLRKLRSKHQSERVWMSPAQKIGSHKSKAVTGWNFQTATVLPSISNTPVCLAPSPCDPQSSKANAMLWWFLRRLTASSHDTTLRSGCAITGYASPRIPWNQFSYSCNKYFLFKTLCQMLWLRSIC
jgi:hypothetical protein